MVFIKEVELENIRSHRKTRIELTEGINIFYGRTGIGKTSVLMAIEFAFFSSKDLKALLRRNATRGKVIVTFQSNGKEYKVVRGLMRQGDKVVSDPNCIRLFENGRVVPVISRVKDFNQKLMEILGFPKNIKVEDALRIYKSIIYTEQKKVDYFITIGKEERQKLIDSIFMFSKYNNAFENLRDVINWFEKEVSILEEKIRGKEFIKKEINRKENLLAELKNRLESIEKENMRVLEKFKKLEIEFKEYKEKKELLNNLKQKKNKVEGKINYLIRDIERISRISKELENEIKVLEREIKAFNEEELEEIEKKINELIGKRTYYNSRILDLKKEEERLKKLKGGVCPLCKREISKEEVFSLLDEINKEILNYKKKIDEINEIILDLTELKDRIKELEFKKKNFEKLKYSYEEKLKEKNEKEKILSKLKEELNNIYSEIESIELFVKKKENIENDFIEISKKKSKIESELKNVKEQIERVCEDIKILKSKIEEIEKCEKNLEKVRKAIEFIKGFRNKVKDIRNIIRLKFLSDFRSEFREIFSKIRTDDKYLVDIDEDYTPIAYTKEGDRVNVSHLSGGEQTSVALAYRLALSNVATIMNIIRECDLLILDEPTYGFDREDVLTLCEILQRMKKVKKQIIVVTHSPELRDIGDNIINFEEIL